MNKRKAGKPLLGNSYSSDEPIYLADQVFTNTLPDIPCPVKFLHKRKHLKKLGENPGVGTLAAKHWKPILCGWDVGVDIETINYDLYRPTHMTQHWKDLLLFDDNEIARTNKKQTNLASKQIPKSKSSNGRIETKIGGKKFEKTKINRSRDVQLEAIEKTFEDAKKPCIQHYEKSGVYAVEELPILPDRDNFGYSFVPIIFSTYPEPTNIPENLKTEALRNSQLCNIGNACGHFVPTVDTLGKIFDSMMLDTKKQINQQEKYIYQLDRQYSYVRGKTNDEFYFRVSSDGNILYGELDYQNLTVSRLRQKGGRKEHPVELHLVKRALIEDELEDIKIKKQRLLNKPEPGVNFDRRPTDLTPSPSSESSSYESDSGSDVEKQLRKDVHWNAIFGSDEEIVDEEGNKTKIIHIKQEPLSSCSSSEDI